MQVCEREGCQCETEIDYDICPDCYNEYLFMDDFFEDEDEDWTLEGVSYASELQGLPDCITDVSNTSRYAVFEKDTRLKLVPVDEVDP